MTLTVTAPMTVYGALMSVHLILIHVREYLQEMAQTISAAVLVMTSVPSAVTVWRILCLVSYATWVLTPTPMSPIQPAGPIVPYWYAVTVSWIPRTVRPVILRANQQVNLLSAATTAPTAVTE